MVPLSKRTGCSRVERDPQTIRSAFRRARPNAEHAWLYEDAVRRRQADQTYNLCRSPAPRRWRSVGALAT